jgi:hypothetical protein
VRDRTAGPPQPEDAATAAEFVAALSSLRQWSGLTYRQLAAEAASVGAVLPPSTTATVLGRVTLPREDFVAAFIRACGFDEAEAARWVLVRKSLAAAGNTPAQAAAEPPARPPAAMPAVPDAPAHDVLAATAHGDDEPTAPADDGDVRRKRRRRAWLGRPPRWVVVLLTTLTVAVLAKGADGYQTPSAQAAPPRQVDPVTAELPPDGWYGLTPSHVADRDLCVGEGKERNKRTDRPVAVQRPCADLVPDTYLRAVGVSVYAIEWHHPEHGIGCLTVDGAFLGPEALLSPTDCTDAAHQRFLLDPSGEGFRMRPVHSGSCVGALHGGRDVPAGAEMAQKACDGQPDQVFLIRSRPAPAH